jgi:hypothetical protein
MTPESDFLAAAAVSALTVPVLWDQAKVLVSVTGREDDMKRRIFLALAIWVIPFMSWGQPAPVVDIARFQMLEGCYRVSDLNGLGPVQPSQVWVDVGPSRSYRMLDEQPLMALRIPVSHSTIRDLPSPELFLVAGELRDINAGDAAADPLWENRFRGRLLPQNSRQSLIVDVVGNVQVDNNFTIGYVRRLSATFVYRTRPGGVGAITPTRFVSVELEHLPGFDCR